MKTPTYNIHQVSNTKFRIQAINTADKCLPGLFYFHQDAKRCIEENGGQLGKIILLNEEKFMCK